MRKIREALRLHLGLGLSLRQTAESLSVAYSTIAGLMHRARAAQLSWPLPDDLDDAALERLLYQGNQGRPWTSPEPDWNHVHTEVNTKGVTLELGAQRLELALGLDGRRPPLANPVPVEPAAGAFHLTSPACHDARAAFLLEPQMG